MIVLSLFSLSPVDPVMVRIIRPLRSSNSLGQASVTSISFQTVLSPLWARSRWNFRIETRATPLESCSGGKERAREVQGSAFILMDTGETLASCLEASRVERYPKIEESMECVRARA